MRKTLLALGAAALFAAPALAQTGDIVETATGAGDFSTLLAAAEAADLVETLKGEGPFTIFAPTDAAFAALPEGTVEDLLKPENKERLTEILTYHVVPGEVMSSNLAEGMTAETVQGGELTITLEGGPKVNGTAISQPDVDASNGVIHVIDGVLMPGA
ncbi:fasciclin domain-containing protein [Cereibacter sediminicola]|uniref:fasciclin domain-containing protein n=1 Tax=Cereibacter sediminicola TaxID=2584941 RepID=UPI0011A6F890|nr:fasciclin domain-containing protein [Cereibacter sediminicola]